MEDQCSPYSWGFCYQDERMEELKHTLLYTTLELETTLVSAKEEIAKREYELIHLKEVLSRMIKERDEANTRYQKMMLENLILQQKLEQKRRYDHLQECPQDVGNSSEDESKSVDSNKGISSADSNNKGVVPSSEASIPEEALKLAANRPLPEKGKLLQAVKEAGPLLQTILLAGPLPQWQHPPPQLHSIEIPPMAMAISSPTPPPPQQLKHQDSFKRGLELYEGSDSSPRSKYQKTTIVN